VDRWCDAVIARHTASLSRPEFLKAVRALSARYVEARGQLPDRSPLDSAGKRAAFAAFYAPLHFFTTRQVVRALGITSRLDTILDLGAGTGTASAGWALECAAGPTLHGVDRNAWALSEAAWNWRQLGLRGSTDRRDLVDAAARMARSPASARHTSFRATGVLLGWAVNELTETSRLQLLGQIGAIAAEGATVLVIEPIARAAAPWWPGWVASLSSFSVLSGRIRSDEWKFDDVLPDTLAELSEAAGFRERTLKARSLLISPSPSK